MSMNRGPSASSQPTAQSSTAQSSSGQPSSGQAPAAQTPGLSSAALRGAVDLSALADRASRPSSQVTTTQGSASEADGAKVAVDVNDASFEQFMQLSAQVICLVGFYADQVPGSRETIDDLGPLVAEKGGRIALGRVRGEDSPSVFQAFQLQAVPAAVALIKGQPVPIFQGTPPADWADILDQLIQLGDEHGVTGVLPGAEAQSADSPAEPQRSPEEEAAFEAIERGDYAAAQQVWRDVLANRPADAAAKQGLVHTQLLERVASADATALRERAASDENDLDAHLAVADLDLFNGHVEDAFTRLIRFVAFHAGEEREAARVRLVELFEVVGSEDPAVPAARRKLAAALF